ncbi:MAG TPA: GNAT family N-acetyltransferase [Candidatus Dormibacteraeota bacterium]|nr:GNAT family N-acetyltransferase [Candidatus Dormibacteraeota bacterium]
MPEPIRTERLDLVPLEPDVVRALIAGGFAGLNLPSEFPTPGDQEGFLPIQLRRMEADPERREWMARLIVRRDDKAIVGHCGFHGPPDVIGRAEIGYTVFTAYRGLGLAKEAARALVAWAFDHGQEKVYATVAPSNAPSLAVVRRLGFTQVGTQVDEVDGLELVFVIEPPLR